MGSFNIEVEDFYPDLDEEEKRLRNAPYDYNISEYIDMLDEQERMQMLRQHDFRQ